MHNRPTRSAWKPGDRLGEGANESCDQYAPGARTLPTTLARDLPRPLDVRLMPMRTDSSHLTPVRPFDRQGKAWLQCGNQAGVGASRICPASVCAQVSRICTQRGLSDRAVAAERTCPLPVTCHSNIIAVVVGTPRTSGSAALRAATLARICRDERKHMRAVRARPASSRTASSLLVDRAWAGPAYPRSMSRITGAIVALAMAAAVVGPMSTDSTTAEAPHASPAAAGSTADLPRTVPGGVELTLADGDLLRIWAADNHRAVWAKRRDAATGTWGGRREVLRTRNLFCAPVDARTANGAVAAIARCDDGAYIEEDVPTASRALWSPDGATWSTYPLEGEAYDEPGISPDGRHAVWPQHGRYVTRSPAGFDEHTIDSEGQEVPLTATVTDAAQVSFLYFVSLPRGCRLVVLTRTGDSCRRGRTWTPPAGAATPPSTTSTATRSGPTAGARSPVAPSSPAPTRPRPGRSRRSRPPTPQASSRPGRARPAVLHRPRTAPARPRLRRPQLRAGPGLRSGRAVVEPAVTVYDADRWCHWGDTWTSESIEVLVAELRCGQERRAALTTGDGTSWRAVQGAGPHAASPPTGGTSSSPHPPAPTSSRASEASCRSRAGSPAGATSRSPTVRTEGGAPRRRPSATGSGRPSCNTRRRRDGLACRGRRCRPRGATAAPCMPRRQTLDSFDIGWRVRGYTVRIRERDGRWSARRDRR